MQQHDKLHAHLVLQFHELLRRDWEVKLVHIYREGNLLADYLAGQGHNRPLRTHFVEMSDLAVAT
ncbi:hypothetical protein LINGRAPRIM_LOCUS1646 [Linum grandiflorum]